MGDCQTVPGIPVLETVCCENGQYITYLHFDYSNLDVTQHHWVELLTGFTFSIKYQKGRDNAVADALSGVASKLDAEVVKSILDRVTIGTIGRADVQDLVVTEADEKTHKQGEETAVQVRATHMCKLVCNGLGGCTTRRSHTQNFDGVDLHP